MINPRSNGEVGDTNPQFALHTFLPIGWAIRDKVAEFGDKLF